MIHILLVDELPVVRSGYRCILRSNEDVKAISEASNGESAIQSYFVEYPDLVIMDINLPDMDGIKVSRLILEKDPAARILIITLHEDQAALNLAMSIGILGFITKRTSCEVILSAVRKIAKGGVYFEFHSDRNTQHDPFSCLTDREKEVFRLIAEGHTVFDIAHLLGISPKTAGVHQTRIIHKLGVQNSVQLVRLAFRYGLVKL